MTRLKKTLQNYQEQLKVKGIKDIPEFVQFILNADITKGKYSRFLLDCYLNDKFREEDLEGGLESTVGQAITLFHKHKGKLPEDMRSVYKYETPGDLWNAVKQFDGELSGKEIKREEQDKVYAETEFVYTDEETGFKIVSPLTEDSAKWWGKGTRWCTSAENNNMFEHYADYAPLLILFMPGGEKFQLWKGFDIENTIEYSFMDEADNEVKIDYIEQNWDILEPVMKWFKTLKFIPEKFQTNDLCKEILKINGFDLNFVSSNLINSELYDIAIDQNYNVFHIFQKDLITESHIEKAIQYDGYCFSMLPEKFKTQHYVEKFIMLNGFVILDLPEEFKTEAMYKLAVQENGKVFSFLPLEFQSEDLKKISEDWIKEQEIKKEKEMVKTKEECMEKIKSGISIYNIPSSLIDEDIAFEILNRSGTKLFYIPKKVLNDNLYKVALKQNGIALQYIPEEKRTEEFCKLAVQQNSMALQYVPEHMQDNMKKNFIKKTIQHKEIIEDLKNFLSDFYHQSYVLPKL